MPTRRALAPLVAAVLLTACAAGSEDADVAAPSPAPSPVPTTGPAATPPAASPTPAVRTVSVTYADGQVTGTRGREEVRLGEQVVLRVVSDVDEEIHVHGYDLEAALPAGAPVDVPLTADLPGVFEVELHDSGKVLYPRGDAFEVWSTLLGRLSPLGRRDDGRLVVRSPLDGADGLRVEPGLVAVVVVLLGSTGYDGLSRTQLWGTGPGQDAYRSAVPGTAGLLAVIAVVAVLYVGATMLGGVLSGSRPAAQPALFAHSLVPIAAGYAVAHYFSLLLLDGQATWILASNPFGQEGVDLFGTYGRAVDYTLVSPRTIANVQVLAIVLGHVVGVVLAHDRAVRVLPRSATLAQVPLVAVMVTFTVGGLALLLSS